MRKFVLDTASPFIVPIANWSGESVQSADEPLRTVTSYPKWLVQHWFKPVTGSELVRHRVYMVKAFCHVCMKRLLLNRRRRPSIG